MYYVGRVFFVIELNISKLSNTLLCLPRIVILATSIARNFIRLSGIFYELVVDPILQ